MGMLKKDLDIYAQKPDTDDPIHPDNPSTPGTTDVALTINYKLLLCLQNTITSWLTIFNENMRRIDLAMHDIALRTSIDGEVPPEAIEDLIKLNESMAEAQTKISTIENTINQIEDELVNLQVLQGDVAVLKQNYINLDTAVSALNLIYTSLQQDVQKLQNNLTSLEQRFGDLETKVLEDEGKISSLEDRVTALENA